MNSDSNELVEMIRASLNQNAAKASMQFRQSASEVGVRYCVVDNLLPEPLVERAYRAFPAPERTRLLASFREKKYTSKNLDEFDPVLKEITFAIQDPKVVALVESITGIAGQVPDPSLYAGGLSMMGRGHFLNPHIDNSHDAGRTLYRTLNLLFYVTPGWRLENGGNLELWDRDVRRHVAIVSQCNRLVIMETNPWSWHSVSPVTVDGLRCCLSNYYFSPLSPTGTDYFNVTSFSARPEQKARRALAWVDNRLRQLLRLMAPHGFGRRDVYMGAKD